MEPDAQSGVEVERDGAVLRLNRPERRNAFDLETMYAFGSALAAADAAVTAGWYTDHLVRDDNRLAFARRHTDIREKFCPPAWSAVDFRRPQRWSTLCDVIDVRGRVAMARGCSSGMVEPTRRHWLRTERLWRSTLDKLSDSRTSPGKFAQLADA